MGIALKLPANPIATAQLFMHRFFMRESFKRHKYHDVCAAAMFLATKVEETGRRLRRVIQVAAQKALKNDTHQVDESSKEFRNWWDNILYYEEKMLAVLCWDMKFDHPYQNILMLCKHTNGSQALKESAWAFVSDSYRYPFCLHYTSPEIAAACFILAKMLTRVHAAAIASAALQSAIPSDPERVYEIMDVLLREVQERDVAQRMAILTEMGLQ
ncbi:hypothetical protein HDU98_006689 [Podochytrium sp. JEL0797]|nr:hypothetical protein HDU98_006689 [Podochytrium sp. JEL0797]